MKRTAFLQACLLFLLLVASWFLLMNKLRQPGETAPAPTGESPSQTQTADPEYEEETTGPRPEPSGETEAMKAEAVVPVGWREWFAYLENTRSPEEMRTALDALRTSLLSLSPEEAVDRMLELIESGADLRTGLAFQPGPENRLRGAASLRALLLDWLQPLDPEAAARIAARELDSEGTELVPDVYVIHLRNYALGSEAPEASTRQFLENHFTKLINHRPWIDNPGSAIAEAMDVAVYLESTDLVPEIGEFLQSDQPRMLRQAASLTMERLVDRNPMEVLPQLLDSSSAESLPARSRASYMARLDPRLPGAPSLLDAYIESPASDTSEIVFFLQSFPNLNQSYSHNLLSTNIPNTEPGGHMGRLESALAQIRRWQNNPDLASFEPVLETVGERLESQLGPNP